jgi:YVTN family beta-propeller protein
VQNIEIGLLPMAASLLRIQGGCDEASDFCGVSHRVHFSAALKLSQNVYITNEFSNDVSVIDTASNTVTATVRPDGANLHLSSHSVQRMGRGEVG